MNNQDTNQNTVLHSHGACCTDDKKVMSEFMKNMSANMSIGENGHVQYDWTSTETSFNEELTKLFFQLVRSGSSENEKKIRESFRKLLVSAKKVYEITGSVTNIEKLYVLIGNTRDIVSGKGEYKLGYILLDELSKEYPDLTERMATRFVEYDGKHPLGSWKDIKYYASYVREQNELTKDYSKGMQFRLADMFAEQLKRDLDAMKEQKPISLAAKWLPSEKTKESWLFKLVAERYNGMIPLSLDGRRKMYKDLRKVKSTLNKYLDTTQVKMCGKEWSSIDFNNVTSVTMTKQRNSFMNVKKNGVVRYPEMKDRVECSEKFTKHIDDVKKNVGGKRVNGIRTSIYDLVKGALYAKSDLERDVINAQWKEYKKNNKSEDLGYMIPMADTSGSMEADKCLPLYNSIGLAIRCSEMAQGEFMNKVLTFSENPEWVDLTDYGDDFVCKVVKLKKSIWGLNTNFYAAMEKILECAAKSNMTPAQVEKLHLCVFSDMQIDEASLDIRGKRSVMFDTISKMCLVKGMECGYKSGFNVPHIVFWNLRSTSGFPVATTDSNVTMVSGYSSTLLNLFVNKGVDELKKSKPEEMLLELLENERYDLLRNDVKNYFGLI
jgi:hypothetical protein